MAASQVCSPRTVIPNKAYSSDDMFTCKNLHNKTHERGWNFAYMFSKCIVGTCVNITHHWDVMYTDLYNLQRGATAASPRRTHISKHEHPSPCQPWRCECGWLRKTRILLFFFPLMAEVNRACLGVCTPLRAIKPAQFRGRHSRSSHSLSVSKEFPPLKLKPSRLQMMITAVQSRTENSVCWTSLIFFFFFLH